MSGFNLAETVKRECLRFGDFTLASGKKSNYYLDIKRLTLSSHLWSVCRLVRRRLVDQNIVMQDYDAVAGMETAANQLVGSYLTYIAAPWQQYIKEYPKRGGIVRKEEKLHGLPDQVIGSILPGDRVVLLEDVATTGGSMVKAVESLELFGCRVIHALCIVDRQEGAAELLLQCYGLKLSSLLTTDQLGIGEAHPVDRK